MQQEQDDQTFNVCNDKSEENRRKICPQYSLINQTSLNISNFKKLSNIGENLFSNVCMVRDINTNKVYAAKNFSSIKNFLNQINISRQISHSNILKCTGYSLYDFNNNINPIIFTEYCKNGSLKDLFKHERKSEKVRILNDELKFSFIYQISCAMSYLHSKEIIHRDLKPSNILLDDNYYPLICDFGLSKFITSKEKEENDKFIGTPLYMAPENWKGNEYTAKSDVYAFGLIMYEILIGRLPFADLDISQICYRVSVKNEKLTISDQIHSVYKELINSCLSNNPSERPSFDEIVQKLKNNENTLSYNITNIINESHIDTFYSKKNFQEIGKNDINNVLFSNNFLCISNDSFQDCYGLNSIYFSQYKSLEICEDSFDSCAACSIQINKCNERELLKNHINQLNIKEIDLNQYEKIRKIGSGGFGKVFLIRYKRSRKLFAAKKFLTDKNKIHDFLHELKINSEIKHPSITKLIGYSLYDFNNDPSMIIITEYVTNGSLERILQYERDNDNTKVLNETMKLITIYRIAYAISYLHSKGILHLDIKPNNVLMDEFNFAKICDFGISLKIANDQIIKPEIIGTFSFMSPEIIKCEPPTTKSDVYSFGMLLYEIISKTYPFEGYSINHIINKVVNGVRPKLNKSIPKIYRKLINSCWDNDPNKRPSFEDILNELRNNKEFITEDVDESLYLSFINIFEDEIKGIDISSKRDKLFQIYNIDDFYKSTNNYTSYSSYYSSTITNKISQFFDFKKHYNEYNNKINSYSFFKNKIQKQNNDISKTNIFKKEHICNEYSLMEIPPKKGIYKKNC